MDDTSLVLAFTSLLQKELKLVVEAYGFRSKGEGPLVKEPSSLITIEPFVPGGLRRLVLNANSPLVQTMAHRCITSKKGSREREQIIQLASVMIITGSWPIEQFDNAVASLHWSAAFGLICGPHMTCCWPVPHWIKSAEEVKRGAKYNGEREEDMDIIDSEFDFLSIFPLRTCGIKSVLSRKEEAKAQAIQVNFARERWAKRDAILWKEWRNFLECSPPPSLLGSFVKRMSFSSSSSPSNQVASAGEKLLSGNSSVFREQSDDESEMPDFLDQQALVAYGPCLPMFALAETLSFQGVPLAACLPSAASLLLKRDKLFGLSLFFGVPLLDRTSTLKGCLNTVSLAAPPTMTEVENYRVKIGLSPKPMIKRLATHRRSNLKEETLTLVKIQEEEEGEEDDLVFNHDGIQAKLFEQDDVWWKEMYEKYPELRQASRRSNTLKLCHSELSKACLAAAEALWKETEVAMNLAEREGIDACGAGVATGSGGDALPEKHMNSLLVMWSGGIDSTGALVALLRTAETPSSFPSSSTETLNRMSRLKVVLDEESTSEYPFFYQEVLLKLKVNIIQRKGRSVSEIASIYPLDLLVTGELGDQIFGSDKCKNAFPSKSSGFSEDILNKAFFSRVKDISARYDEGAVPLSSLLIPGIDDGEEDKTEDSEEEKILLPQRFKQDLVTFLKEAEVKGERLSECFAEGLVAPWERTVLPALSSSGYLASTTEQEWKSWISPQLQQAPFPILTTHDLLWWLNFSCKWQQVSLRCCHDGGPPFHLKVNPKPPSTTSLNEAEVLEKICTNQEAREGRSNGVVGMNVRHFYETKDMELWSCVYEFHKLKFSDLGRWETYKEPLKAFIFRYTQDADYYQNKQKVPSLNHGIPNPLKSFDIETLLGFTTQVDQREGNEANSLNSDPVGLLTNHGTSSLQSGYFKKHHPITDPSTPPFLARPNEDIERLSCLSFQLAFGVKPNQNGSKSGARRLSQLVRKDFLSVEKSNNQSSHLNGSAGGEFKNKRDNGNNQSSGKIFGQFEEDLNPWTGELAYVSSFENAPYFAINDERQNRSFNPVTEATLDAKGFALLPRSLVLGRTVLDLGSCLGALCHHALMQGATRVVAVEVQPDFCERSVEMLTQASTLWPPLHKTKDKSQSPNQVTVTEPLNPLNRFEVVCSGIREFLASAEDGAFDVVVAAGVLHCFEDPSYILRELARVCKHSVVIEADHVEVALNGSLREFNHGNTNYSGKSYRTRTLAESVAPAPHVASSIPLLQLAPQSLVNKSGKLNEENEDRRNVDDGEVEEAEVEVGGGGGAKGFGSFSGLAVVPSRNFVEEMLVALGFDVTRVNLAPHPTKNMEVQTYSTPRKFSQLPKRYFIRCTRPSPLVHKSKSGESGGGGLTMKSLEASVVSGDGTLQSWNVTPRWWEFRKPNTPVPLSTSTLGLLSKQQNGNEEDEDGSMYALPESAVATATAPVEGAWSFEDKEVASRFDREAMCHIPDYVCVIEAGIDAIERGLSQYAIDQLGFSEVEEALLWARAQRVVDIGSATGTTMVYLLKRQFLDVHGVEAAAPMLVASENKLKACFGWTNVKSQCYLHFALGEHYLLPTESLLKPIPSEHLNDLSYLSNNNDNDDDDIHLYEKGSQENTVALGTKRDTYLNCQEVKVGVGAILCNWTLHFISDEKRRFDYLRSLFHALQPGGVLVLTDKTEQGPKTRDSYHVWKTKPPRSVSRAEVEAKAKRLVGVLVTFSTTWYEDALKEIGFDRVSVLWSRFGFVTWLAFRPSSV